MNEHTLCCGTVADKAKLCAEIEKRDSVIRAQQRRIGELLQERDEALAKQVICASGCKEREALHEALAYAERLRLAADRLSFGLVHDEPEWNPSAATSSAFSELQDSIAESQETALSSIKSNWQAEAVENAIKELSYCGYDGQAWVSELEQYALKLRAQEPN